MRVNDTTHLRCRCGSHAKWKALTMVTDLRTEWFTGNGDNEWQTPRGSPISVNKCEDQWERVKREIYPLRELVDTVKHRDFSVMCTRKLQPFTLDTIADLYTKHISKTNISFFLFFNKLLQATKTEKQKNTLASIINETNSETTTGNKCESRMTNAYERRSL